MIPRDETHIIIKSTFSGRCYALNRQIYVCEDLVMRGKGGEGVLIIFNDEGQRRGGGAHHSEK